MEGLTEEMQFEGAPAPAFDEPAPQGGDMFQAAPPSEPLLDDTFTTPEPEAAYDYPAAVIPEPETVDPRIAWAKANLELLKKKDTQESAAKREQMAKGKEHLNKFHEARKAQIATRKANNRAAETVSADAGVPAQGSTWDKITGVINFNEKHHSKDIARYKNVLFTCKQTNVAVH